MMLNRAMWPLTDGTDNADDAWQNRQTALCPSQDASPGTRTGRRRCIEIGLIIIIPRPAERLTSHREHLGRSS